MIEALNPSTPSTRAPSPRTQRTRLRLIEAARSVLIENSGAAEIGAIARRAGVSAGLAYHHFGSKDGLVAAVVEDFYARYTAVVNARYEGETWAEREIQRTRETVLFLVGDPFTATLFGPLGRSGAVVEAEAACMAGLVELGARNIAQGQAEGDLPRQIDAGLAAAFVLGGLRHAVATALLAGPKPDPIALARTVWVLIAQSLGLRQGSHS
jgi:AcrR family transcriptional regulator